MNNLRLFLACGLLSFLSGCQTSPSDTTNQHLDGLGDYFKQLGYSFHNPPRLDRKVGSVFKLVKSETGKTYAEPVCRQIFVSPPDTQPSPIGAPNEEKKVTRSLGISLSLLSSIFTSAPNIGASLSKDIKTKVTYKSPYALTYAREDVFKDGKPRTITDNCYSALINLSENGGLTEGKVYILTENVYFKAIEYEFDAEKSGGLNIEAEIAKVGKLAPEVKSKSISNKRLKLEVPLAFAFRSSRINDFVETGLQTAEPTGTVFAAPLTIDENTSLFD